MTETPSLAQISGQRIRRSRNVVSGIVAGEAIVVPIRRGAAKMDSIYTFNESGAMLWSMIERGRTFADLIVGLESEYGLSIEEATADLEKFIARISEAGLIEK